MANNLLPETVMMSERVHLLWKERLLGIKEPQSAVLPVYGSSTGMQIMANLFVIGSLSGGKGDFESLCQLAFELCDGGVGDGALLAQVQADNPVLLASPNVPSHRVENLQIEQLYWHGAPQFCACSRKDNGTCISSFIQICASAAGLLLGAVKDQLLLLPETLCDFHTLAQLLADSSVQQPALHKLCNRSYMPIATFLELLRKLEVVSGPAA